MNYNISKINKGGQVVDINYLNKEKTLIIKIFEDVDHHNVQEIRRRADYEIERRLPKRVIFDFNNVSFMDSAGIGMLIGRYKTVNLIGGKLEIANIGKSIEKIFEMCGILKLIPVINYEEKVG